jgi:hypothetical protein
VEMGGSDGYAWSVEGWAFMPLQGWNYSRQGGRRYGDPERTLYVCGLGPCRRRGIYGTAQHGTFPVAGAR